MDTLASALTIDTLDLLRAYNVVVLTDSRLALANTVNYFCRSHGIKFIWTGLLGVFGYVFVDFGASFEVFDKDGLLFSLRRR